MPNPHERNKPAITRAVKRLHGAIVALWQAGASWEEIEDEIEEAQREAGVDARVAEK
jgi:hypothetical protein